MNRSELKKIIVLVMVLLISIVFISMIRNFIMAILLAGIFSTMAQPLFKRLVRWFRGRENLASLATLLFFFLIIVIPLAGLLGIVAGRLAERYDRPAVVISHSSDGLARGS